MRRIVLTPSFMDHYKSEGKQGYRLAAAVTEAEDMPDAIFRYLVRPARTDEDLPRASFSGVCTPSELEDLEEDEPNESLDPPFFRRAALDIVLRSRAELEEAYAAIQEEIQALINALNAMDAMSAAAPIEFS